MPSWDEIINQVESAPNGVIDITRKEYISKLAEIRVLLLRLAAGFPRGSGNKSVGY